MDENVCKICASNIGKYVCPRCNLLYCSVKCYQSRLHIRCSEEFYKENVLESMSNNDDPQDANKMKEILHRMYTQNIGEENSEEEEEILDSDDEVDLAERLSSVCLDNADAVWEKLSEAEKQEFVDFLHNGCPESVVLLWEPWWTHSTPKQKIEELDNVAQEDDPIYVKRCPILKDVQPLSNITKREPAQCIVWNILNVIAAYSYVMRYFNGDTSELASDASTLLVSICGNLNRNKNYECYDSAVDEVAYEIIQCPGLDGSKDALSRMKDDVDKIINGPDEANKSYYLKAALSDVIALMEKSKNVTKKPGTGETKSSFSKQFQADGARQSISKDKLKIYIKKIEYYLSWVNSR